jgi:hypothetical protein
LRAHFLRTSKDAKRRNTNKCGKLTSAGGEETKKGAHRGRKEHGEDKEEFLQGKQVKFKSFSNIYAKRKNKQSSRKKDSC